MGKQEWGATAILMLTAAWVLPAAAAGVDAEDLKPGLVATYRDVGGVPPVEVSRLEPTIALGLQAGEAPHPRLAADNGTARWEGYLNVLRAGSHRFQAVVRGRFRLQLDGKEVFMAESSGALPLSKEGAEVRLEAGPHRLLAEFTRQPGAALLEVSWQSAHCHREPLPYDVLGHVPASLGQLEKDALAEHGRFLAEERNCTSCHRAEAGDRMAKGLLKRQAPDLSQVGQRAYAGWLYRWLKAPNKVLQGAIMPQLFDDDEAGHLECYAVASYLASLGGSLQPGGKQPSPGEVEASRNRGKALFTSVGCIACHGAAAAKAANVADILSFYGLAAPEGVRSTVPLTGLGDKTTPERLAAYLGNPLAIDPSGRMPHMPLQGREAEDLARYLCHPHDAAAATILPAAPPAEQVLTAFRRLQPKPQERALFQRLPAETQVRNLGKYLVTSKGCANCHTIAPGGRPLAMTFAATSFEQVKKREGQDAGCLAATPPQRDHAPVFDFSARDRQGLQAFLTEGSRGAGSPAPAHAARVALKRFNCLACHNRDGEGGLTSDLVEELRRYEKAENAEAVNPPPLTGAGHKLRTLWLRQVLTGVGRARPWMGLRMPQFGEAQVGRLPEALAALEGIEPENDIHKVPLSAAKIDAGRYLTGKNAFGCISCHDLAGIANTGTRGPDLAGMNQRVRYDWYRRWLEQPQRMSPGTRMPTIFNEGKSLLQKVLGGSPDAQAEAVWAYLSLGPGLPLPDGLEQPKGLVLTVKDRPILLRTFMPDAGSRAVAIGFPGGISTTFDAAHCRLAYAWSGSFLDASPVWNDRGGNPAKVLGGRFWTAPLGCPWGATSSKEPPDFAGRLKDPAYGAAMPEGKLYLGPHQLHFEGYSTNKSGQPTFRYQVQAAEPHPMDVSEQPEALHSPVATGVARHFTLQIPERQTAWLLAGETNREPRLLDSKGTVLPLSVGGPSVEVETAGRFLVLAQDGDRVLLLGATDVPECSWWHLRKVGGTWQALLRLPRVRAGTTMRVGLNVWAPYRDEPALLKELVGAR